MTVPELPADREFTAELMLLFVCTANQCRSPMAAGLADDQLRRRNIPARVASCGLMHADAPATHGAVRAMSSRGLDITGHRSRTLDGPLVRDADLILTMERRHLVAVAEEELTAVDRAFTLPELARLSATVGPRRPASSPSSWIAEAAALRDPAHVLGYDTDDDVVDPMGGSRSAYRRTADELDHLIRIVLDEMFPVGGDGASW